MITTSQNEVPPYSLTPRRRKRYTYYLKKFQEILKSTKTIETKYNQARQTQEKTEEHKQLFLEIGKERSTLIVLVDAIKKFIIIRHAEAESDRPGGPP
jgi:predicted patatin/cPLA2 family phospholipase